MKLEVKLLSSEAQVPRRATPESAGYDLHAAHDLIIAPQGKGLIKTDLAVKIPAGCYGRVAPRSGLAWKQHVDVGAGVIDRDYRGNLGVILFNHSTQPLMIGQGDRIAQLILERIETPEVEVVEKLEESERGEGGFGSTGQ